MKSSHMRLSVMNDVSATVVEMIRASSRLMINIKPLLSSIFGFILNLDIRYFISTESFLFFLRRLDMRNNRVLPIPTTRKLITNRTVISNLSLPLKKRANHPKGRIARGTTLFLSLKSIREQPHPYILRQVHKNGI